MKKIITFLVCFLFSNVIPSHAQLLNYTNWEMYNSSGAINFYFYLHTDTLFISIDNITYSSKSTYIESGNTFQITDLPGLGSCQVTEIGLYSFTVQNDTLVFTSISDPCVSREGTITGNYGVRLLNTIKETENWSDFKVFQKPFSDGVFLLSFPDYMNSHIKISVFSSDGKKVYEDQSHSISKKEIDLRKNQSGIYCIVFETGNKKITRKILLSEL